MYDLIILGGGPAGYNAAERAGHAGLTPLQGRDRAHNSGRNTRTALSESVRSAVPHKIADFNRCCTLRLQIRLIPQENVSSAHRTHTTRLQAKTRENVKYQDVLLTLSHFLESLAKSGRGNVLVARTAANRGQRGRCPSHAQGFASASLGCVASSCTSTRAYPIKSGSFAVQLFSVISVHLPSNVLNTPFAPFGRWSIAPETGTVGILWGQALQNA